MRSIPGNYLNFLLFISLWRNARGAFYSVVVDEDFCDCICKPNRGRYKVSQFIQAKLRSRNCGEVKFNWTHVSVREKSSSTVDTDFEQIKYRIQLPPSSITSIHKFLSDTCLLGVTVMKQLTRTPCIRRPSIKPTISRMYKVAYSSLH